MLTALLLSAFSLSAVDSPDQNFNNGQDILRPLNRFDIRAEVQQGAASQYGNAFILTLRNDQIYDLPQKWQLSLRADAPFNAFRCPRKPRSCPCINADHMGDSLFQCILITPTYGKWTYGAGAKVIFPTGGRNLEIGDGKYQILPSFAFKYSLENWSEGSYLGVLFRQAFSFAGYRSAPRICETYIQPFFNLNLPYQWFINSSPEMFFDWVKRHWFIPFDLMIGKMITKSIVVSLEYEAAIVRDYPDYNQQLEFRIGFFF